MKKYHLGFTLLELMIVVVILGVLAAMMSGNFINSLKKGRDARRKADLEQIQKAIEMYYEDKKEYPIFFTPSLTKLCESDVCTDEKVYMQRVPTDPTNSPAYSFSINSQSYRLYACLENPEQILPYDSLSTDPGAGWCSHTCNNKSNTAKISCIFVLTDSNSDPY